MIINMKTTFDALDTALRFAKATKKHFEDIYYPDLDLIPMSDGFCHQE